MFDWQSLPIGVLPKDAALALSGLELMQRIVDGRLPHPSYARAVRFRLSAVAEGFARIEGETGADLHNPSGTVHGGWALTLIDSACGVAAHTLLPACKGQTTVDTRGHFARPMRDDLGTVFCEGRVVSSGRSLISAEARLVDGEGRLLAHGGSTLMIVDLAR